MPSSSCDMVSHFVNIDSNVNSNIFIVSPATSLEDVFNLRWLIVTLTLSNSWLLDQFY